MSWYKHHLKNFFHAVKFPKERKGTSVVNPDNDDDDEENEYDAGLEKKPMQNKEEPTIVVQAVTLPEISDPSLLLKEQSRRSLYTSLPALVQGRKWVLLYR